jgi:hypothetical protein
MDQYSFHAQRCEREKKSTPGFTHPRHRDAFRRTWISLGASLVAEIVLATGYSVIDGEVGNSLIVCRNSQGESRDMAGPIAVDTLGSPRG